MARSAGLASYLPLSRRNPGDDGSDARRARPPGPLVWVHAGSEDGLPALLQIAARLDAVQAGAIVLVTATEDVERPARLPEGVVWDAVPAETTEAADAFLDHWKPDVGLWSTGNFRASLLNRAGRRSVPMVLIDADESAIEDKRRRWLADVSRRVVTQFRQAFARTANAGRRLQKLGMPSERIEVIGPLQQGGLALPCDPDERSEIAATLGGRSTWLAAMVRQDELPIVLDAHRQAARATHRLLLILVPAREEDAPAFAEAAQRAGWRTACWSRGEMPSDATQILLADTLEDMGLWYRLSPIAFMGSSLTSGHGGSDPFEAAALGAAVLYGPNTGRYTGAYRRLAEAGAARVVRDAATLSAAVSRLTAPDQAAAMAHAAWSVATEGAEATDRVVELVQEILDERGRA